MLHAAAIQRKINPSSGRRGNMKADWLEKAGVKDQKGWDASRCLGLELEFQVPRLSSRVIGELRAEIRSVLLTRLARLVWLIVWRAISVGLWAVVTRWRRP